MKKPFVDLSGQRFGRLVVLEFAGKSSNNMFLFRCRCDCGKERVSRGNHLIRGEVVSCGCYRRDVATARRGEPISHGHCTNGLSPTYQSWSGMLERCGNPNHKYYKRYGGRGIIVCERWKRFENFLSDMGKRPDGKTLDRKNNNGNYEPGNCQWSSIKEQQRNLRSNRIIEHGGRSHCLAEWAEIAGIKKTTLKERMNRGWSIAEALEPL